MPAGRQLIRGYGDGGFRIDQTLHVGCVVVFAEETLGWPVAADPADLTVDHFDLLDGRVTAGDILLVGCGPVFMLPPKGLKGALKDRFGVILEWMDTGAACRTFNVLLTEERRVVGALFAV